MHPPCRHCQQAPGSRPRGLCWRCHSTPAIVALYPSMQHRGAGLGRTAGRPAAAPTAALPGTWDKVRVLEERAGQGEALWHPDDARIDDMHRGQVVLTIAAHERRQGRPPTELAQLVLATLQAAGEPLTTMGLARRLGLEWKAAYFALVALRGRGLVERLPGEQAYRVVRLAGEDAA